MVAERHPAPRLRVRGIKGLLQGEERLLRVGETLVVGRSRSAGLSTRRAAITTAGNGVTESESFKSVSRRHVSIRFLHPGLVEIKDLSANGTFLDGKRIDCVAVTDFRDRAHIVELGRQERLYLEMTGGGEEA